MYMVLYLKLENMVPPLPKELNPMSPNPLPNAENMVVPPWCLVPWCIAGPSVAEVL